MLYEFNSSLHVLESQLDGLVVRLADEDVDVVLVMSQERVHVGLVEEFSALGLREDEVGKEEKAEEGVEGEPGDNEVGPVVKEGEDGEDDPVHEPWRELSWIRGAKGFVGGEDGKHDGYGGSVVILWLVVSLCRL